MGVDDLLNLRERALLNRYRAIHERWSVAHSGRVAPPWAHQFRPTIPVVGGDFGGRRMRVLVYASAENLTWAKQRSELPSQLWPEFQMIRGRVDLAMRGGTNVHIHPVDNGSLLKVARHILHRLEPQQRFSKRTPNQFLQEIAVANPGKFSVDKEVNKDTASNPELLAHSVAYIKADLAVLEPEIVILPATVLSSLRTHGLFPKSTFGNVRLVPIFQLSPQAINIHLTNALRGGPVEVREPHAAWPVLVNTLRMDRYFQWIEERVKIGVDSWIERTL